MHESPQSADRRRARAFGLAAVACLQGAVACGTIWGFEDPILVEPSSQGDAGDSDAGRIVDTPPAVGDPTRTCVPRPPEGWEGPLIVFEGSGSPPPEPPPCPAGYRSDAVYDGNSGLVAPDAECSCACGPETGGSCEATLTFFQQKTCDDPCGVPDQQIGTTCTTIPASCDGVKLRTTRRAGTCAPTTGAKNKPPAVWGARGRVCAPTATTETGCAADRVGTPTTALPFATATYCVAQTGEAVCPDLYPNKRTYYAAINDSRDCQCACDAPQGGSCSGTVTAADNAATCKGGEKTVQPDFACWETKKPGAIYNEQADAGACAPTVRATGSATPATPTTVCCTR